MSAWMGLSIRHFRPHFILISDFSPDVITDCFALEINGCYAKYCWLVIKWPNALLINDLEAKMLLI